LGGAVTASVAIRVAERMARPAAGLAAAAAGQAALTAAATLLLLASPDPLGHAYGATTAVLAGYALLHAAVALLLASYCLARLRAGFVSENRRNEVRIARLWADFAGLAGAIVAIACLAPGILA
jgi:cytochrome c oxidase subunit I+III